MQTNKDKSLIFMKSFAQTTDPDKFSENTETPAQNTQR